MPTPTSAQQAWQDDPPESLVIGDGPYAAVLAAILQTSPLPAEMLQTGPVPSGTGGLELTLTGLKRVFLVVGDTALAGETIGQHRLSWDWIRKLTRNHDEHELVFLFVLPENGSDGIVQELKVGLNTPTFDPATTGHAVWRRSGSLTSLLDLVASVCPMDYVTLRSRQAADGRRLALSRLHSAVASGGLLAEPAREVLAVFAGCEYHLDLFCRPPSHRHGNLLRNWLHRTVSEHLPDDPAAIASWLF